MKIRIPAVIAAVLCCMSCIKVDYSIGGNLVPINKIYDIYSVEIPLDDIVMRKADSLDARSTTRMSIGAIRDEDGDLSTRACAMTLVPLDDTLDFGDSPVFRSFIFQAACDSVSVADKSQENIIQNVRVYELSEALDPLVAFDCNSEIKHRDVSIVNGMPTVNGKDSLVFNFTKEYGQRFIDDLTQEDLQDFDSYIKKFPGIYIETDAPSGQGGRFNMYELQLGWDANNNILTGNVAALTFTTKYDFWDSRKDTTFLFYFGAAGFFDMDSLVTNTSRGNYPEVCFNVTGYPDAAESEATDYIYVEGGGSLKPVIKATALANIVTDVISQYGGDPETVFINKASVVLPYVYDPEKYDQMYKYPQMLSPTARIHYQDSTGTHVNFNGLTDSSKSEEDPGDIDRSNLRYSPDITYHLQSIIQKNKTAPEDLESGDYDIWLLVMAYETITTTSTTSSDDMSEYYQYLAYQNYYNNMYGGYGGYGGGYGYNDYYSNYYSYMMASMYASSNSTTTTTSLQLDKERYYKGKLYGPANKEKHPTLKLTFSVPKN